MKKTTLFNLVAILFAFGIVIQACSKDDDDKDDTPKEPGQVIANSVTFADYKTWPVRSVSMGADPSIGDAHGDNDSTVTRTVYVKDGIDFVDGKFPQGAVIVKVSENTAGTLMEYTAMVKRGGNFNKENNGWEWFVLNEDGTILKDGNGNEIRGDDLFQCTTCHSFAPTDYIYTTK